MRGRWPYRLQLCTKAGKVALSRNPRKSSFSLMDKKLRMDDRGYETNSLMIVCLSAKTHFNIEHSLTGQEEQQLFCALLRRVSLNGRLTGSLRTCNNIRILNS